MPTCLFCSICNEKFEKVFLLHNHRAEKHGQNDEIIVCFCESAFENAKQYREHFKAHRASGFKCLKCNMFKPYLGRFQHFKNCDGTPVGVEVKKKEKEEVKKKAKERGIDVEKIRLKCNFCEKHKRGNKQLQLHISRIHPKCPVPNCDFIVIVEYNRYKKFDARIHLNRHIRKEHQTEIVERPKKKMHTCPNCSFKSEFKSNIARHLIVCDKGKPQLMISF